MTPILLLPKLFLAGGAFLGTLEIPPTLPFDNHTLAGEKIQAVQVVTRDHWGTPMLPDGKGGYSLIAPINKQWIEESLWIPPVSGTRPVIATASAVSVPSQSAATVATPKP